MNGAARNSTTDPYRGGISGQETRTAAVTDLASGNARNAKNVLQDDNEVDAYCG